MIPVLIVPVLANTSMLFHMLQSIDHPVEVLVVIDNGGHVSQHRLSDTNRTYIKQRYLWRMPHNLGVPTSWNLGIKATPFAPWWLISNFDVIWPAGSLQKLSDAAGPDKLVLNSSAQPWCAFTIGEQVVDKVGLFDEGIHPAYWEDVDYRRRVDALNIEVVLEGVGVIHANSSTLAAGYWDKNQQTFAENATRAQTRATAGDMSSGEWSLEARRRLSWD